MLDDLFNIKYKLKHNKSVSIYTDSLEIFKIVEKLFLTNGYFWNGRSNNSILGDGLYRFIKKGAYIYISENFLTFSPCNIQNKSSYDIFINDKNVNFYIKNIFIKQPNYIPRKKIDRII